jgi:hypothetical protein
MSVNNRTEKQPLPDISTMLGPGQKQGPPAGKNSSLLLAPQFSNDAHIPLPVPLRATITARPSRLPKDLVVVALDDESDNSDKDMPNTTAAGSDVKGKGAMHVETVGLNTNTLSNDPTSDNGTYHNNIIADGGGSGSNSHPPTTYHNPKTFLHKGSKGGAAAGVTTLVISNRAGAAFSPNVSPCPSVDEHEYTTIAQETLGIAFEEEEGNVVPVEGRGRATNMTTMSDTGTQFPVFTPRTMGTPLVRINECPSISHGPSSASSALLSSSSPPNERIHGGSSVLSSNEPSNHPSNLFNAQPIAALESASRPLDSPGNPSTSTRKVTAPR